MLAKDSICSREPSDRYPATDKPALFSGQPRASRAGLAFPPHFAPGSRSWGCPGRGARRPSARSSPAWLVRARNARRGAGSANERPFAPIPWSTVNEQRSRCPRRRRDGPLGRRDDGACYDPAHLSPCTHPTPAQVVSEDAGLSTGACPRVDDVRRRLRRRTSSKTPPPSISPAARSPLPRTANTRAFPVQSSSKPCVTCASAWISPSRHSNDARSLSAAPRGRITALHGRERPVLHPPTEAMMKVTVRVDVERHIRDEAA